MNKGKVLIDEVMLQERIKELALEITNDFKGEEVTLICILKGAMYFFTDLTRRIDLATNVELMRVSSYQGENSTGKVDVKVGLDKNITGKNVIVVEDIIDSGITMSYLLDYLRDMKPKKLKLCALLDKPSRREIDNINIDYVGFVIPNRFVIGYGLDLDEQYRNIPTINCITSSIEEEKQIDIDKDSLRLQLKKGSKF